MTDDPYGLKKLDKDLKKSFDVDLFKEKKFPTPKPRYSGKHFLSKSEKQEAKKAIKMTRSTLKIIIDKIKNRKINKLEKEYFKIKEKSEKMAHEIKLRSEIQDKKLDVERYSKELEKLKDEEDKP